MKTLLASFVLGFLASLVATPLARRLALRLRAVDAEGGARKIHAGGIPRLGGLAIVFGFFVPTTGWLFTDTTIAAAFLADWPLVVGLFGGGLIIVALGIYDDIRGAAAPLKLSVQCVAALLLIALGFRIDAIANPFADSLAIGWLAIPLTLLWVVGMTNAMNLIDGLDGLAAAVAFVALATTVGIALQREQLVLTLLSATMAGAVLGFMPHNLNPARIFMGDSGSMFLGFVLALTSLRASQKSATTVALLVPAVALALPITDTALAVVRRLLRGQSVFVGDRDHIHHRLLARGLSQSQVVLLLAGGCALLGLTALVLTQATGVQALILLVGVLAITALTIHGLGYTTFRRAAWRAVAAERRRNRLRRVMYRLAWAELRRAKQDGDVWLVLQSFGATLGCAEVRFRVVAPCAHERLWRAEHTDTARALRCSMLLQHRGRTLGEAHFAWCDGRAELTAEEDAMLRLLGQRAAVALAQKARPAGHE